MPAISGHRERADSQDSGGYTEELTRTLPRRIPMALLLGDLPGIQQAELDASGDVDDAGLAGFARREVAGLLALARADPAAAVADEAGRHEDLQQESSDREVEPVRGKP